ncbi:YdiU family protein [Chitinibacter bivalviorum]|uniref:Protein nucleotidyltransferase YdiU n=1 Tax=Chitinibacter bivalviorum TaxID=2739434 RepID=A0A7H9BI78_9NEIS|nr:YdiU family protein [Chitinibacter bivalviorum]QLG87976.1 YdiU family protein [Chitinibacter bivalviorum]
MAYTLAQLPITPRFTRLHSRFWTPTPSTPMPAPHIVALNTALAEQLGIDVENDDELAHYLVGNRLPQDSAPSASVYSGHQFGVNVPQLGDGRALLIAEFTDPNGTHWEMQLKGAGPTPYSRRGDGRAVLRSSIREYLASEALHHLGIPSNRALAIGGSPQTVWRETRETAAVVTRLAPTFVRFGHFEYYFYQGEPERITELADWVITHHYPACQQQTNPYLALLNAVIERTATLIAQWQAVGFCHGVMNTDNMSILGLTIDYGPFGFLDGFDAGHICNHSDDAGRYAYNQQPQIGLWNLHCLAQALLPLVAKDDLLAALGQYQSQFETAFAEQLRGKLGFTRWQEDDWTLVTDLFELMQAAHTDWTIFWRTLSHWVARQNTDELRDLLLDRPAFDQWLARYSERICDDGLSPQQRSQSMLACNPKYILRNHLAQIAIDQAEKGDFSEVDRLFACLCRPFDEQSEYDHYAKLPPSWVKELSVSCSS